MKGSWALRVVAGATVVKVGAPFIIIGVANVVAVAVLGAGGQGWDGYEAIINVDDLKVAEVARLAEACVGEMARAHLSGRVPAIGSCVHNLPTPLHHGGMVR